MRLLRLTAILAALMTLAPAAQASTGWARYEPDSTSWVRWQTKIDQPASGEDLTPAFLAQMTRFTQARRHAIRRARHDHRAWLEEVQAARRRVQPASVHSSGPYSGGSGGSLRALVCSYSWSCAVATCIVSRESGWNPRAYNSSSGAAGLWQWLPGWYRGHFDPFNPTAATAFAWVRYNQSGWSDWHSDQNPCY